ncbi:MAG: hypothetical protein OHK0021_06610 [Bryobacter sp.]
MKLLALITLAISLSAAESCPIDEDFTRGRTQGQQPLDPGQWTPAGWRVDSQNTQLKYDLGRHYRKGSVEVVIQGPLNFPKKTSVVAGWNEEAAADGDRRTQNFLQLRLQFGGMMLRLTNRAGGRSFEKNTGPLEWGDGWYRIRGEWDTAGGTNRLYLNDKLLQEGKFNAESPGLRWFFLGKDNYQKQWSVPGMVYRSFKLCVEDTPTVAQWHPFEATLENPRAYQDPYRDVELQLQFTRPDGKSINYWGFYDGGKVWKFRLLADQLGKWTYTAKFSDGAAATSGSFEVTNSDLPGLIGQYAPNPIWFGYRGGARANLRSFHVGDRFFAENWPAEKRKAFLDWAQAQKYNTLSIASHYWNRDVEGRGRGWQTPKLWPLNAAEYQKMEAILDDLARRRLLVYPFAGFFGKDAPVPQDPQEQDLFVRYTLARLGAYWNILFLVGGPEPLLPKHPHLSFDQVNRLGLRIKEWDPFHHALSVHNRTGSDQFLGEAWPDYGVLQGPKTTDLARLSKGLLDNHHPAKPLYAQETLWPGNTVGHPPYSLDQTRKNAFVVLFSAAAWNMADMQGNSSSGFSGSLELGEAIAARHQVARNVWDLFESLPFEQTKPRQDLVEGAYCLAAEDRLYLVYLPAPQALKLKLGRHKYQGEWIDARDGLRILQLPDLSGEVTLHPPPGGEDWILKVSL